MAAPYDPKVMRWDESSTSAFLSLGRPIGQPGCFGDSHRFDVPAAAIADHHPRFPSVFREAESACLQHLSASLWYAREV
jgi:hypothetical protein